MNEKKSVRLVTTREKTADPNDMDTEQLSYWDADDGIPGPFTRTRAQEKTSKYALTIEFS